MLILALMLLTRRATWASVATLVLYPLLVALAALRGGADTETAFALFTGTVPLALIAIYRHRSPRASVARRSEGGDAG